MAWSISDLFPIWGDGGEKPSDNFNYQGGDQVNEKHLDYLWSSLQSLEDEIRAALTDIDSDKDGIVDEADTANLYKNNDIDNNGDGVVNSADQLDSPSIHDADQFSGANGTNGQILQSDGTNSNWSTLSVTGRLVESSGAVDTGDAANIYTIGLADTESLEVTEAGLLQSDGQAAPSGVDLIIASLDNAGGGTSQTTIISGDGATVFDDSTGTPLASYTNNTGVDQTVMVAIDNGNFNVGSGAAVDALARAVVQVN